MKVVDIKPKEQPKSSDLFQAAADMCSDVEEQGVEPMGVALVFFKGEPTIAMTANNIATEKLLTLLEYAKMDVLAAMRDQEFAEVYGEDGDDTIH